MTPDQIAAEIAEKAEKATPGPWKQHLVDDTAVVGPRNTEIADCWAGGGEDDDADFCEDTEQHEADAAYIAAANPANLKVLLADRAALLAIVQKVAALRLADANGGKDNIICGSDKFDVAGIVKAARAALTEGT